jgi:hypothetical protein
VEPDVRSIWTLPGKIINLISDKIDLLRVQVSLNGQSVMAIIDTGAESSLISQSLAATLNIVLEGTSSTYRVIGGDDCETVGSAIIPLSIHGVEMQPTKVVVFPTSANSNISLLLGIDFLKLNSIEICVKRRLLIKHFGNGGNASIYIDGSGKPFQVMFCNVPCYASADINLQEGKVQDVPIVYDIPLTQADHMLLYSDANIDRQLSDRVSGITGIAGPQSKTILMLASETSAQLKRGQSVGTINSILQLDDDEVQLPDSGSFSEADLNSKIILSELSLDEQREVFASLNKVKPVFSTGDADVGLANVTSHHIKLTDSTPIYQRPRRFAKPIADEIERQCSELNSLDIIESSISPWSSPVVPVRKKDGSIRMCIDHRQLNRVTIPDKFPVPNLSDSIFGLHGTQYFTKLDLVRGYYQLPIDEESRQYTAFSTPRNHWQFKRLSFGLRNAPAAFQREIQAVLNTFPSNKVIAYIDDILIMGNSFREHLDLVSKVLQTLVNYNIKIKPSKCEFFKSQVEYLGHTVSKSGIKKTVDYVNKISEYPRPVTVGDLREFLGFINFQRKFLPNCSEIQKPLSCLTGQGKKKILTWTPEMIAAFDALKSEMEHDLELAYPDYSDGACKLGLWVDASAVGSGAYLAQQQGESHRVIGFASMTFTDTQLDYSTLERELTALRWGVKTFRPFLYGISFILYTDHQPLVHLHNMKIVCSRLARTVEELSDFIFDIYYVPGKLNTAADALSRLSQAVPLPREADAVPVLPKGLVIEGLPAPGGGDSLFVSLHRLLAGLGLDKGIIIDEQKLRELLVDDLLNHASQYNIQLDRDARKRLILMRFKGQLAALDVLLSASKIFKVKICVYFWTDIPVIYQYEEYEQSIHLQCISGIHFNPLVELNSYAPPDIHQCSINTVQKSTRAVKAVKPVVNDGGELLDETLHDPVIPQLWRDQPLNNCGHNVSRSPQVTIAIGDSRLCAVLDTGAEISLVSVSALKLIQPERCSEVRNKLVCEIVGFTGLKTPVTRTIDLMFTIGRYSMPKPHEFAIVPDEVFPFCFLLGLDFMLEYGIDLDFNTNSCKHDLVEICQLVSNPFGCSSNPAVLLTQTENCSHQLKSEVVNSDVRFEIEGNSFTITGLSLLTDNNTIKYIQSHCPNLKLLYRHLMRETEIKAWPNCIKNFSRFVEKLSIQDGIIVYSNPNPVIVVSFNIILELATVIHFGFAHLGRDKLLDLISPLAWHPARYKISNDVCTTCHQCQIVKQFSTPLVPPTLKIKSEYPFELVAADLISLPRTSNGYVGCLMVVDHYSKWVTAVPIKNKTSATIIHAFDYQIFPFLPSVPTNLLTDNGPEFTSSAFSNFLDSVNVTHKLLLHIVHPVMVP